MTSLELLYSTEGRNQRSDWSMYIFLSLSPIQGPLYDFSGALCDEWTLEIVME